MESDLVFSKENVRVQKKKQKSPLSRAIKSRQKSQEDAVSHTPEAPVQVTVFLPSTIIDGKSLCQFVQFEVTDKAVAKNLIQAALSVFFRNPKIPKDTPRDPGQYRIYLAEEDGTIDTDVPALDAGCPIASTGATHFALQKKERTEVKKGYDVKKTRTLFRQ